MRWLGAILVLVGAGSGFMLIRKESMQSLLLAQVLLVDLGVLSSRVCMARKPLPAILEEDLSHGLGAQWLWNPLRVLLKQENGQSLLDCWAQSTAHLPPPLDGLLAPLGPLLPTGGTALAKAIEETREELTRFLREERIRQTAESRLTAAVCLSGACFLILVLI